MEISTSSDWKQQKIIIHFCLWFFPKIIKPHLEGGRQVRLLSVQDEELLDEIQSGGVGGGAVAGHRHVEHVLGERPDVVLEGRDALLEKSTDRLGDVVVGRVALAERREDGQGLLDDDEHGLGDRVAWDNTRYIYNAPTYTFVTLVKGEGKKRGFSKNGNGSGGRTVCPSRLSFSQFIVHMSTKNCEKD